MIRLGFVTILSLICSINLLDMRDADYTVFPTPKIMMKGNYSLKLNNSCKFFFQDSKNTNNIINHKFYGKILDIYSEILHRKCFNQKNYDLTIKPYHFNYFLNPSECFYVIGLNVDKYELLDFNANNQELTKESESYELDITYMGNTPKITLNVKYLNGLIRGLESLSQLIGEDFELKNLPLYIKDKPDFAYRGLMIDTGRHYLSVEKIKTIIRGMMHSKLSVLHWHIVDNESFPYDTPILNNSNAEGEGYSKNDIINLVFYAKTRGVTIVPEFDNPSHTRSWDRHLKTKFIISSSERWR